MHYVYVIQSKKDLTYYIGSTSDLKKRFKDHNLGKSKYTKTKKPWKLVYYEAYNTLSLARKRENKLKKHSSTKEELLKRII